MAGDSAINVGTPSARSSRFSASRRRPAPNGVAQIDLRLDDGQQPVVLPRLLDEIARAAAHGFHRQAHRAPGGHHDHRQHGVDGADARKQVQPFLPRRGVARVVQIHDHDVEIARFKRRNNRRGRSDRVDLIAFALQQQAQRFQNVGLIVGDQNARRSGV